MGIYIHVPFCRNKCFYCGFYSVASLRMKEAYIRALAKEIELRKDYLPDRRASTLYLGGGTPSYLDPEQLECIVEKIHSVWHLEEDAERSIEMNPEDVTPEKLSVLRGLGFNRLTIGIQSFNDDVLKRINRNHTAAQALEAIERATAAGFDNVGIDLILGLPGASMSDLEKEIEVIRHLNIQHISIYILSIDSNSVFEKLSEKGKFEPQDDDLLSDQFVVISCYLKDIGYEHYEISNFARNSKYSRHNTSYWQQKPYIGLGPSAHSFDGISRQWNVSNLKTYIDHLDDHQLAFEKEILTPRDVFNEYLMTNFRTMWGIDTRYLLQEFPDWWKLARSKIDFFIGFMAMVQEGDRIRMTEKGWLISDDIFRELFV